MDAQFARNTSRLIEQVYSAGIEKARWQTILDELAAQFPGAAVSFLGHDIEGHLDLGHLTSGYEPDFVRQFVQHYSAVSPWAPVLASAPVGVPLISDAMYARSDLVKSEFYADWLRPQDNLVAGIGVNAQSDGKRYLSLAFTLPEQAFNQYRDKLTLLTELLGPHLRRSVEIARRLSGADISAVRQASLEMTSLPLFLVDARGMVHTANAEGEQLQRGGQLLSGGANGRALAFLDPAADRRLKQSLDALVRHDYSGLVAPFPVYLTRDHTEYLVTITPYIPEMEIADGFLDFLISDRPVAIVALSLSPGPNPDVLDATLSSLGLTPAERALALAIHQGHSLQSFADERDVSIHTARNQLRSVYDKLDVRRQGELAVLVGRLSSVSRLS